MLSHKSIHVEPVIPSKVVLINPEILRQPLATEKFIIEGRTERFSIHKYTFNSFHTKFSHLKNNK